MAEASEEFTQSHFLETPTCSIKCTQEILVSLLTACGTKDTYFSRRINSETNGQNRHVGLGRSKHIAI